MKKALATLAIAALAVTAAQAQVSYSGGTYSQDFDVMGSAGTTTPTGWFVGTGTGAAVTGTAVVVGTGSSTAGGNYNFGSTGSNERALGSLAAASTQRDTEVHFTNDTGTDLTSLTISYDGEQWRSGGTASVANTLTLQLSLNGLAGSWANLGAGFNFVSPQVGQAAGALDGNAPANRIAGIGGTYDASGTPILAGSTFYLRWADPDDASSDQALAVDNFSLSASGAAIPEPATIMLLGVGLLIGAQRLLRKRS